MFRNWPNAPHLHMPHQESDKVEWFRNFMPGFFFYSHRRHLIFFRNCSTYHSLLSIKSCSAYWTHCSNVARRRGVFCSSPWGERTSRWGKPCAKSYRTTGCHLCFARISNCTAKSMTFPFRVTILNLRRRVPSVPIHLKKLFSPIYEKFTIQTHRGQLIGSSSLNV